MNPRDDGSVSPVLTDLNLAGSIFSSFQSPSALLSTHLMILR